MYKVAICGASGYTGSELLRILTNHPFVKVTAVTSERNAGSQVTDLFQHLCHYEELVFEPLVKETLFEKADIFFMALPHGTSQEAVAFFASKEKMVLDLSADYRLKDPDVYEKWYGVKHNYTHILKDAVYGLPELNRKDLKDSKLIALPGCYPTAAILGLYPAFKYNLIEKDNIIIDAKSGTSGAGRKADIGLSFSETYGGFRAYNVAKHRHTPEIEQILSLIASSNIKVTFTPHLLPVSRGILCTTYATLKEKRSIDEIIDIFLITYSNEPFIRVLKKEKLPDIKRVCLTNHCDIGLTVDKRTNKLIIVTAIDNLVKGASGQAVQSMNIMLGLDEITSLKGLPPFP